MGYTTYFDGEFTLNKKLTPTRRKYLQQFNRTRRMKRDAKMTDKLPDPTRKAVKLPVGIDGGYYVGSHDDNLYGQSETPDVLNYNEPPTGQPGLWCGWTPNEEGTAIVWDGGEKFYKYVDWIKYLIAHFLAPWGYVLNGEMHYTGEESDDFGYIVIKNNVVKIRYGIREYGELKKA